VKYHLVSIEGIEQPRIVKAHTKAGAERHVRASIKPAVTARVPTQDELVAALRDGIAIEDATNSPQASIPKPAQTVADKVIGDITED